MAPDWGSRRAGWEIIANARRFFATVVHIENKGFIGVEPHLSAALDEFFRSLADVSKLPGIGISLGENFLEGRVVPVDIVVEVD